MCRPTNLEVCAYTPLFKKLESYHDDIDWRFNWIRPFILDKIIPKNSQDSVAKIIELTKAVEDFIYFRNFRKGLPFKISTIVNEYAIFYIDKYTQNIENNRINNTSKRFKLDVDERPFLSFTGCIEELHTFEAFSDEIIALLNIFSIVVKFINNVHLGKEKRTYWMFINAHIDYSNMLAMCINEYRLRVLVDIEI